MSPSAANAISSTGWSVGCEASSSPVEGNTSTLTVAADRHRALARDRHLLRFGLELPRPLALASPREHFAAVRVEHHHGELVPVGHDQMPVRREAHRGDPRELSFDRAVAGH